MPCLQVSSSASLISTMVRSKDVLIENGQTPVQGQLLQRGRINRFTQAEAQCFIIGTHRQQAIEILKGHGWERRRDGSLYSTFNSIPAGAGEDEALQGNEHDQDRNNRHH